MADWVVVAAIAAAVVLAGAALVFIRLRRNPERRLGQLLRALGNDYLRNVVIPDGTGGEIHVDCVILTPRGLIVLDVNDTRGTIFAGDRLDAWSATHEGRRFTFENPISQLQRRAEAVQLLARGVPVAARILFINDATFPKGHPAEVATMDSLLAEYEAADGSVEGQTFEQHWEKVQAAVISRA